MNSRAVFKKRTLELMALSVALSLIPGARAADTDIYGFTTTSSAPNLMLLLDNTANWSGNNQGWNAGDSWTQCNTTLPASATAARTACQDLITKIYYPLLLGTTKRPWESGYKTNSDNVSLTQGQVQLRSLKLVLNDLVCTSSTPLSVNVGLALLGNSGTFRSNGDASGFVRYAVQRLSKTSVAPAAQSTCATLIADIDLMDSNINSPTFKAPANANYGAAMFEIFKYFGGFSNPTLTSQTTSSAGSPQSNQAYGPLRFSKPNTLDDTSAFTEKVNRLTYSSPFSAIANCGNSYMVLFGNGYPNAEPAGAASFEGLNYTPPTLPSVTSDTTRKADEWAYFLANSDVSPALGTQSIKTVVINTYYKKPDADQAKLLKSMAAEGGVGPSGYLEVGGDLTTLIGGIKETFTNIAAVNSAFTATTLPVSTTTQGAYLNQIFVGMFRPDSTGNPRWLGNLKQYQLGLRNGVLDLLGTDGKTAISTDGSFFAATATSFWSESSVFFSQKPSGTPLSISDFPDGAIVDKGGAAQMLRKINLDNANERKVYTLPATPVSGAALSATPFTIANASVTSQFSTDEINWIRGVDNNQGSLTGREDFTGSKLVNTTPTLLINGARPSIHGDVLHSRPLALSYAPASATTTPSDVVVYYGSNDGHFHAVDGRQASQASVTAGQELWSFLPPELYASSAANFKRLRAGTPLLHTPENGANGALTTPASDFQKKTYGMDGPIGSYARYNSAGTLTEGIIFPTMRRGGNTVYAIDVTVKTDPKFMWKITGGSGDFAKLAQTWSLPKPIFLSTTSTTSTTSVPPPILMVMGGGYDEAEDALIGVSTAIPPLNRKGNVIYVFNGRTGTLIKSMPTEYSVPADVSLVDMDSNGIPDRGYVADVRGNLYRFDFPTGDLMVAGSWANTAPVKIAELGGKVFFPPDIVRTNQYTSVLVGTGDREKPLQSTTSDNFFLIKDRPASTTTLPMTKSSLTRVAKIDNTSMLPTLISAAAATDVNGCYLELATNGEKVINAPLSVAGATYFGTNRPKPASSTQCNADLGEAYAYKFPLFCGTPAAPTSIVGGGLMPNPVSGVVLITNADGKDQAVPFLIGGGKGGSSFRPEKPEPVVAPVRKRLYWRIENSNR
jgi:type IV pilus assembly protein PilY1